MRKRRLRSTKPTAEVVAELDRTSPGWRKLPADKIDALVARSLRTRSTAEIVAQLNHRHPGWRSLPDGEIDRLVARLSSATGRAYLTLPERGPTGEQVRRFTGFPGANSPPDLAMARRQYEQQQEQQRVRELHDGMVGGYRAAVLRWATERAEARRLRIAGYEHRDVQDAAQRAAQGQPPATSDEIEQRAAKRFEHDRAELFAWRASDLAADERFRTLLAAVEKGDDRAINLAAEPGIFDRIARGEDLAMPHQPEPEQPEHDSPLQRARRRLALSRIRASA